MNVIIIAIHHDSIALLCASLLQIYILNSDEILDNLLGLAHTFYVSLSFPQRNLHQNSGPEFWLLSEKKKPIRVMLFEMSDRNQSGFALTIIKSLGLYKPRNPETHMASLIKGLKDPSSMGPVSRGKLKCYLYIIIMAASYLHYWLPWKLSPLPFVKQAQGLSSSVSAIYWS